MVSGSPWLSGRSKSVGSLFSPSSEIELFGRLYRSPLRKRITSLFEVWAMTYGVTGPRLYAGDGAWPRNGRTPKNNPAVRYNRLFIWLGAPGWSLRIFWSWD